MEQKQIVYIASECEPFFSTGNLGSVVNSISNRINKLGKGQYDVSVILPLYSHINRDYRNKLIYVSQMIVNLSWRKQYCGIYKYEKQGVTFYFLDNDYYFKRHNLYGYFDDAERFAFLSKAALDMIVYLNIKPSIIHAHDHLTGLVPVYLRTLFEGVENFKNTKSIFTIHSVDYQGVYGLDDDIICDVYGLPISAKPLLDYNNNSNVMKAAMETSDFVTTVSKTFAKEILTAEFANGLEHQAQRVNDAHKLFGILHGIDKTFYNPAKDKALFEKFDRHDASNRYHNKLELQKMLSLPVDKDIPMIGLVGPLIHHKGFGDLCGIMDDLMKEKVQVVILGTGDSYYEELLTNYSTKYRAKVRTIVAYNEDLARKIFAASDLYLVPSLNEPCGLNHMIASRYGAVPIVRSVGGLKDTVKDFSKGGNGYVYSGDKSKLLEVIKKALNDYNNHEKWEQYQQVVMNCDFGWTKSSNEYLKLYNNLLSVNSKEEE